VLSTTHITLSDILLSSLTSYADEIIEDRQCGFRRNGSATELRIRQILGEYKTLTQRSCTPDIYRLQ
jgi:hypothetical protein